MGNYWTNKSVKLFAGNEDPIQKMERVSRQTILKAMDAGWSGPPFDPIELARILKIKLIPNVDIPDARTVPDSSGSIAIEFNPSRPKGRLRFSIAHEIAHTFFEDCADQIRNRHSPSLTNNDWQLEMLCNLGAAELIMPIGSHPAFELGNVSLYSVLELRKSYQVSTEALLIRLAKLSSKPIAVFCGARMTTDSDEFRIDYVIPSKNWSKQTNTKALKIKSKILSQCTAIGYIAEGKEKWAGFDKYLKIESVGLPPYPGSIFPRVAGIIKTTQSHVISGNKIRYHEGDATAPGGAGTRIIAHIVNDKTPNWGGGGFAVALKKKYKHVQSEFKKWVEAFPDSFRLGESCLIKINDELFCFNMIAQRGYRYTGHPLIRYEALGQCLEKLADTAEIKGASIHIPRIGTGNAGGSWEFIEELISEILIKKGIEVNVYDLVTKAHNSQSQLNIVA